MRSSAIVLLCLFSVVRLLGQNKLNARYFSVDSASLPSKVADFPATFPLNWNAPLRVFYNNIIKKGYPNFSIDSIAQDSTNLNIWYYLGDYQPMTDIHFTLDSTAEDMLYLDSSYRIPTYLAQAQLDSIGKQSFQEIYDRGHLLARVAIDSFIHKDSALHIYNSITAYHRLRLDSLKLTKDLDMNYELISKLLSFESGVYFEPSMLTKMEQRINNIPYLQLNGPAMLDIKEKTVNYELPLSPKNINQANIVIGIQPNTVETGKLLITGDAKLRLVNALNRAESLDISWQQLQYQSPQLKAELRLPYLLYSNFGMGFDFSYFRKDTTWQRVNYNISGDYIFDLDHLFSLYYSSEESNLLQIDTNKIKNSAFKMDFVDFKKQSYGMRYARRKVDRAILTRSGFSLVLDAAAKNRKSIRNSEIIDLSTSTGVPYRDIYDSLDASNWQLGLALEVEYYYPIQKNMVWYNKAEGKMLSAENVFKNEMYQIGGYSTLRGYDDQSLYAQNYALWLTEFRYLLGNSGFLSAFYNAGYLDRFYSAGNQNELKMGFGLGLNINLQNSLLGLNYAIGQDADDKFDFRSGKIHIAYISQF